MMVPGDQPRGPFPTMALALELERLVEQLRTGSWPPDVRKARALAAQADVPAEIRRELLGLLREVQRLIDRHREWVP